MTKITYKPSNALADEYLKLKAEKADLARRERALKATLERMAAPTLGAGKPFTIEGMFGRVCVSEVEGRVSYDIAGLRRLVPEATLKQCEKIGADSLRFSVSARTADGKKEAA